MSFGAEIWGPPLIQAAGSVASGYLGGRGSQPRETKLQRTQRKLIDDLLASLQGRGSYNDLFSNNPEDFQKSFVEPAKSLFRNQIAPAIQQQYVATGQHRGTALDDQLLRAGVEMDQILNQQLYQFNQDKDRNRIAAINAALGQGAGAPAGTTGAQDVMSGLSGYLSSDAFANTTSDLFNRFVKPSPQRKGFEPAT